MKICLVHEWIVDIGGSEKVLRELISLIPDYRLFTLFYRPDSLRELGIDKDRVIASFLQAIPGISRIYRSLLPLFPSAVEGLDLSGYDVVISSSHIAAKGVIPKPYQLHICYCHTPARYLWDLSGQYLRAKGLDRGLPFLISNAILSYLRLWDLSTINRVDHFIANSEYTRKRIRRYYNRDATVIYPPVDVERFRITKKENFFLLLSRLVPYKRAEIAIEAFKELKLPLVVAGYGPEFKRLRKMASKYVEFMGYVSDEMVVDLLSGARALIYPAEEDFGITMVEALASGTPVIAFARGGASEIVQDIRSSDNPTGILFYPQTTQALKEAVLEFLKMEDRFDTQKLIRSAKRFSKEIFREKISGFIKGLL